MPPRAGVVNRVSGPTVMLVRTSSAASCTSCHGADYTGGTSGVGYLRKMLDTVLFPEIWKLRTDL